MNLDIRRMERNKLERIRDIDRAEIIRFHYEQRGSRLHRTEVDWGTPGWFDGDGQHSFGQMIRGAEHYLDLGGTAFGAFDGDRLAGIAIYRPHLADGMGQLGLLHVSNGYRRRGVGSRLFEEILTLARRDGATHLYVSATPTGSAVGFYTSKGFKPTDRPHPDLLAEEPDDIHMVLEMGGPPTETR